MRLVLVIAVLGTLFGCHKIRSMIVDMTSPAAIAADEGWKPSIKFEGKDAKRKKIKVGLKRIASGFQLPTDLAFVPGERELALVAQKEGALEWLNVATGKHGVLLKLPVQTSSEQGLLGIAFHPDFDKNRNVYLNYIVEDDGKDVTRVAEFRWREKKKLSRGAFKWSRTILEVEQPYANHNAGQLAFGPDGYLYVGLGDGGWANDPQGHGQNPSTLLGSMLRIDVNQKGKGKEYSIPKDNPFIKRKGFRPEVWAYGLRNPWRYSFSPKGDLIVADVGQNKWEEISVIEKGGNYGWNVMEGERCFGNDKCNRQQFKLPMAVYGRNDGESITGGYVYHGSSIKALRGKYVFADYSSKKVWAIDAPTKRTMNKATEEFQSLGEWGMQIASFAQDFDGEIYALDFFRGGIFKLTPP